MKYYVYEHIDPNTGEIVYIGKGSYGRAWDSNRNRWNNPEHQAWLTDLCEQGITPDEFVVLVRKHLVESEAFKIERGLIEEICPRFNKQAGEMNGNSKLTDEQAKEIYTRVSNGETRRSLAKQFGVSSTTISLIGNRKTWKRVTNALKTGQAVDMRGL